MHPNSEEDGVNAILPSKTAMTHRIDVLIFPDFQLLDATGPVAAFEMPNLALKPPPYRVRLVSHQGGAVRSSAGITVFTEPWDKNVDTLLVAGGLGTYAAAQCPQTLELVRAAASSAQRVVSVCSGAYILAAAGLLDGRRATTHWERAADLQRRFPRVHVEPDRIFVRDGSVWTSAGVTAGIDLALALIAEDLGDKTAKQAAQRLVVYHRRPGGQSQFSALLELSGRSDRIGQSLTYAREHLADPLTVDELAGAACLSGRQFARAFRAETGQTPAKAVEQLRMEAARVEIESSNRSLDGVAAHVGFHDTERMRRACLRAFGVTPQALRRAARGNLPGSTSQS
jgi:transcriptional regulator GlxA family with amidase domain